MTEVAAWMVVVAGMCAAIVVVLMSLEVRYWKRRADAYRDAYEGVDALLGEAIAILNTRRRDKGPGA